MIAKKKKILQIDVDLTVYAEEHWTPTPSRCSPSWCSQGCVCCHISHFHFNSLNRIC